MLPIPQSEFYDSQKPMSACLCQIGLPNFSLQAVICYLDAKVCTIPMCLEQSASECV